MSIYRLPEKIVFPISISVAIVLAFFLFTFQAIYFLKIELSLEMYLLPMVVGSIFGFIIAKVISYSQQIKTLSGFIPICADCNRIKDGAGDWKRLEAYIESHSSAQFSHGVCQECKNQYMEKIESMKTKLV